MDGYAYLVYVIKALIKTSFMAILKNYGILKWIHKHHRYIKNVLREINISSGEGKQ